MSNMEQLTKEQLENLLIETVKKITNREKDTSFTHGFYIRGYANGLQAALGIDDSERRKLVREA